MKKIHATLVAAAISAFIYKESGSPENYFMEKNILNIEKKLEEEKVEKELNQKTTLFLDSIINASGKEYKSLILVDKETQKLTLIKRNRIILEYIAELSKSPVGDKLYRGDLKVPEGTYRVKKIKPSKNYYRAILLDYPTEEDKKEFEEAKNKGLIPNDVKDAGNLIEIHGGGYGGKYKRNWTNGCIALTNEEMDRLCNQVKVDDYIVIIPGRSTSSLEKLAKTN